MKKENVNQNLINVVESIDISKIKEYREKIIHKSGLCFQEFFPSAKNNLDFDEFLREIRGEIAKFYIIMQRFVYYSTGKRLKFNLKFGLMSKKEFEKRLKKAKKMKRRGCGV